MSAVVTSYSGSRGPGVRCELFTLATMTVLDPTQPASIGAGFPFPDLFARSRACIRVESPRCCHTERQRRGMAAGSATAKKPLYGRTERYGGTRPGTRSGFA